MESFYLMKGIFVEIGGVEHRGFMDGKRQIFVNLTPNNIYLSDFANQVIIPQSGKMIRLVFNSPIPRISGLPPSRRNVIFIVETAVKSLVNRPDFCVSIEIDSFEEGLVLKPIYEIWEIINDH